MNKLILSLLALCTWSAFAPIPPCSPLRFINKIVESEDVAWLLGDLPGHPQRPCPQADPRTASNRDRYLSSFFLSDPNVLVDELRLESRFWTEKGLPRIHRRFWSVFDHEAGLRRL